MHMHLYAAEDRRAASAIAELCYTNPFSARRIELERQALGPAFREAHAVWSRASLRFENPNLPALRERTRGLLASAHAQLTRGARPPPDERAIHADVIRYHLFDHFDDALTELCAARLAEPQQPARAQRIDFYRAFRDEALRLYGAGDAYRERVAQVPHLFATSVQVRLAFALIYQSLLGTSGAAAALRAATWQSIFTHDMRRYERALYARMHEIPSLVLGPSGTGKELVARAIGLSPYVPFDDERQRFVAPLAADLHALNLSAMPATLIESELFGHRRGAFTSAIEDRRGYFELCTSHGAVFLDEVGELDPAVQVKLLRVLQSRTFQRLGDGQQKVFRGRVIAATNRDLTAELAAGRFRADLFYRLSADTVRTPSLAEQLSEAPGDLRTFVENALERLLASPIETGLLVDDVVAFIEDKLGAHYAWPGNVRELEQCVRSFVVQRDYAPLRELSASAPADLERALRESELSADALLDRYCVAQYARLGTYQDVARRLGLDWRTVKARVAAAGRGAD